MVKVIKKHIIVVLWGMSLTVLLSSMIIASVYKPFTEKSSAIIICFSFVTALVAMIFSVQKREESYKGEKKVKVIIYIAFIVVLLIRTILKLV